MLGCQRTFLKGPPPGAHYTMKSTHLRRAFLDTVPVLTGYLVLGFGFGIIMRTEGYSIPVTVAMSLFIYAGSMQYAAVGLLTGGASLISAAFTTLAVNARHLFYGISMLEPYKGMGRIKPYLIFSLTDETYSLVCVPDPRASQADRKTYCLLVSLLDHIYWVAGTALGALAGTYLRFNSEGIDFALTALFVTVFIEQWLSNKDHIPACIGVGASVLSLLIFGPDKFLIPAMALIAVCLLLYQRRDHREA